MIEVFIEYSAIDESPIRRHPESTGWKVGDSGHLSIGEWVDNEVFVGLRNVEITYAPGKWRWVRDVCATTVETFKEDN